MAEPIPGTPAEPMQVTPVVVLFQVFPAGPSPIPGSHDFVRRCLAESPLTEDGNRDAGETVFRTLLDTAGPGGSIRVAFRICSEHVEVDVLHSDSAVQSPAPPAADGGRAGPSGQPAAARAPAPAADAVQPHPAPPGQAGDFADWMSAALRKQGLTQEAAARLLGVSVKTVSRWIGGTTEPRLKDLRRIQQVFGDVPLG